MGQKAASLGVFHVERDRGSEPLVLLPGRPTPIGDAAVLLACFTWNVGGGAGHRYSCVVPGRDGGKLDRGSYVSRGTERLALIRQVRQWVAAVARRSRRGGP